MANSFDSNFTTKLAKGFLAAFESTRVLSKNVNTQKLDGKFKPDTGDTTKFKRPTDYVTVRTAKGDLTSSTASSIITGSASGTVQNYFTTFVDYDEADQAIKMDELDELLRPMATRMKTDLELDFAAFMMKNSALLSGTYGVACSKWDHISEADAMMEASGIPMDKPWYFSVNPFTKRKLASDQRSLGAGGSAGSLITEAHKKATICENYGGFDRVMTATTMASLTLTGADRAGTLTAAPTPTYLGAKDTMTQTLAVTAFGANLVVKAGEVITVASCYRLNLNTRELMLDETGARILFSGTVTTDVTLGSSGEGNIIITGPAIYEAAGAYNTVNAAAANSAVVTLLGTAADIIQPNLFWHKDAFSIGSVPIKKLYSTDTLATTADGLQFRVSKGSDFTKNEQNVRIDFRPAYAVLNPFFAGQAFGRA
jgi:hypothetical protein